MEKSELNFFDKGRDSDAMGGKVEERPENLPFIITIYNIFIKN
jgi:hypothetical protein